MDITTIKNEKPNYLDTLKTKDYSNKTITNYDLAITKFINYLEAEEIAIINNDNITEILTNYQSYLKHQDNYKAVSINRYTTDLTIFLKTCGISKTIGLIKTEKNKNIKYLTREEIDEVIKTARIMYKEDKADNLEALICFMFTTGSRVHEVAKIKVNDIGQDNAGYYVTIYGKGNKTTPKQPVPATTIKLIKTMLEGRGIIDFNSNETLFTNNYGKPLKTRTIQNYFKQLGKATDERLTAEGKPVTPALTDRLTPHSLRHSLAIYLLMDKQKPINFVKNVLRHENILTTQKYLELGNNELREGYGDLF